MHHQFLVGSRPEVWYNFDIIGCVKVKIIGGRKVGTLDFFNDMLQIFLNNRESYMRGIWYTLLISLTGTIIGLSIGILVGVIRTIPASKNKGQNVFLKVVNWLLNAYISIFRGTPMIVQAMVFYYGTAILWGWNITSLQAAFLIVSINTGAYMSEVVRGGIISVDKGQFEAARAIGMTHWQTMKEIVMPQVFRNVLPSVGNEFVINIKDTSVLNVISVNELYFTSNTIASNNFNFFGTFLVTAVIYFILTYTVTWILGRLERRMDGNANFQLVGGNQNQVAKIEDKVGV